MAKSFDDLVKRTVSREDRKRADNRADEMFVGVLLQQMREAAGLTQKDLAKRLGIKQPSLSKMESQRDIQLSTLRRVAEALGGSVVLRFKPARRRGAPTELQLV